MTVALSIPAVSSSPPPASPASPSSPTSPMLPLLLTTSQAHELAERLDAADPLRDVRAEFSLPAPVYLCGNSLGPMPRSVRTALTAHVDKWASSAVMGHFSKPEPWADIEDEAARLYVPLVGARHASEVAVMNSLTVNIHLMLTAFYRPAGPRCKILLEDGAFSSDEYALQTHVTSRGLDPAAVLHRVGPRPGEALLRDDDLVAEIHALARKGELALVLLPGVQYYTGQVFPMGAACAAAREHGVPIGFDLAHAVGNVELRLHDWGADFAAWCSYKYVNGGPGALSGVFVHERHADAAVPRLAGWWGHDRATRFAMPREFAAQRGARGFQLSNPPVFGVVPVAEALRVFARAGGIKAVRAKSVRLTGFLERLLRERLGGEVDIVTPGEAARRGCQLSLRLWRVQRWGGGGMRAFNARLAWLGVVCDVREPDVLRVAPAPLFNSYKDVLLFACALERVLHEIAEEGAEPRRAPR